MNVGLRSKAKTLAERALVGSGLAAAVLRLRADRVAVLAYHDIIPTGERPAGDRSLHLPQHVFGDQLDSLTETHRVCDLAAAFRAGPEKGKPIAVITFDDAYAGAMTAGLEELKRRDLPATVFVNPGSLEWEGFWWDRIADPVTGVVPIAQRRYALSELGGVHHRVIEWAKSIGLKLSHLPDYARGASLSSLQAAASFSRLRFGSHTWSHPRLTSLPDESVRREIGDASAWLQEHFRAYSRWISYPYGHYSASVASAAAEFCDGALLVSGGLARSRPSEDERFQVPRINIPSGVSARGFRLRLAGLV